MPPFPDRHNFGLINFNQNDPPRQERAIQAPACAGGKLQRPIDRTVSGGI